MPYPEMLARCYEDVLESTKVFNVGLKTDPRLCGRFAQFRAWYYLPEIDAVGPSKFVGYRDISVDFYFAHTGAVARATLPSNKRLDGRETEPRLQEWFEIVEPGTAEHRFVLDMVKSLGSEECVKEPSKLARYCVPIGFRLS